MGNMQVLTPSAWLELARRSIVLVLPVIAATAGFGHGNPGLALGLAALAAAIYGLLPRPRLPPAALHQKRMPTVYMPDLLALLLATTFLAMSLIISAREDWLDGPWGLMLFMWPRGLIALAIFWMAARYQCLWVLVEPDALTVSTMRGTTAMPYGGIARVQADMTPAPRWLKPLLILFGGWRGPGVAFLHAARQSHWLAIERKDGPPLRLPADAFPKAWKIFEAFERAGVRLVTETAPEDETKDMRKPDGPGTVPTNS